MVPRRMMLASGAVGVLAGLCLGVGGSIICYDNFKPKEKRHPAQGRWVDPILIPIGTQDEITELREGKLSSQYIVIDDKWKEIGGKVPIPFRSSPIIETPLTLNHLVGHRENQVDPEPLQEYGGKFKYTMSTQKGAPAWNYKFSLRFEERIENQDHYGWTAIISSPDQLKRVEYIDHKKNGIVHELRLIDTKGDWKTTSYDLTETKNRKLQEEIMGERENLISVLTSPTTT